MFSTCIESRGKSSLMQEGFYTTLYTINEGFSSKSLDFNIFPISYLLEKGRPSWACFEVSSLNL